MIRLARRADGVRRAVFGGLIVLWAVGLAAPLASAQQMLGRQVTIFGVLATPGLSTEDDPKLKQVLPHLRHLLPAHHFKLLKVESKRVVAGETVTCDLGDGFIAASQLTTPIDSNGKIQIRFDLSVGGLSQYQTIVTTPPNQIFYVNRMLPSGERLVIGIGAR